MWRSGTPRLLVQLLAVMVVYCGLFVVPVAAAAVGRLPAPGAVVPPAGMAGGGPAGGGGGGRRASGSPPTAGSCPTSPSTWPTGASGRPTSRGDGPLVAGRWLFVGPHRGGRRGRGGGRRRPRPAVRPRPGPRRRQRQRRWPGRAGRAAAGLVFAVLVGQAVGVLPPTFHFQNPVPGAILTITLDRYLLPLLPLALALAVWAVAGMRLPSWPAWAVTAVLAVVSVAGTHDFLVFQTLDVGPGRRHQPGRRRPPPPRRRRPVGRRPPLPGRRGGPRAPGRPPVVDQPLRLDQRLHLRGVDHPPARLRGGAAGARTTPGCRPTTRPSCSCAGPDARRGPASKARRRSGAGVLGSVDQVGQVGQGGGAERRPRPPPGAWSAGPTAAPRPTP